MNGTAVTVARLVGVQAAAVTAVIHLIEGVPKLVVYLSILSARDPRPYLFVPSGLLLLGTAAAVLYGVRDRRLYSFAAGVMGAYMAGYVWWHLTGHGGLLPSHETTDPVGEILAHLLADPPALVAFGAELVGIVAFLVLFVVDGTRTRTVEGETDPNVDG